MIFVTLSTCMRSKGYCTWSVCLYVSTYSCTTCTKPPHKWYQRLYHNKHSKINVLISLKDAVWYRETGIVEDHVAWPNPSIINSAHAYSFVTQPPHQPWVLYGAWPTTSTCGTCVRWSCLLFGLLVAVCLFNTSWRIVLEGWVAGSALPQTKHTDAASPRSSENWPGSTATQRGVANNHSLLARYAMCAEGFAL